MEQINTGQVSSIKVKCNLVDIVSVSYDYWKIHWKCLIENMEHSMFEKFLDKLGLQAGQHIITHASMRRIRQAFPALAVADVIDTLERLVGNQGSLIIPTFTYCFKRLAGQNAPFERLTTPARTGAVADVFWQRSEVTRTSSPTHSFGLWGRVAQEIGATNSPKSPLGEGSVLAWLAQIPAAQVLLLGTDFTALSFGHYLEIVAPVPWVDFSPWEATGILSIGVAVDGEQVLQQVPGCSRAFVNFEEELRRRRQIEYHEHQGLTAALIPVEILLKHGREFFRDRATELLCPAGTCPPCDVRRQHFQIV